MEPIITGNPTLESIEVYKNFHLKYQVNLLEELNECKSVTVLFRDTCTNDVGRGTDQCSIA
jgi:hypothetical protein